MLTPDQQTALDGIKDFIYNKPDRCAILYAAAGCGKTYLTRVIVNELRGTHRVAGVAPTHKARKVLDKFLNENSLAKIKTMTIASLLSKVRAHSYIGTKRYVRGADTKMTNFDVFLIDEASMISDIDVDLIMNYAEEFKRKILFIGDKYQIPNPSQKFALIDGIASKKDSKAFDLPLGFPLTTVVRQGADNPIIDIYTEIRDAITEKREPQLCRDDQVAGDNGVRFYTSREDWYKVIQDAYMAVSAENKPLHKTRIIAYTNDSVKSHNTMIRRLFKRGPKPEIGELLMGYNNIGWPVPKIENSQDYYVKDATHTTLHKVCPENNHVFRRLVGDLLTLAEPDSTKTSTIFVPELSAPENQAMLQELVLRAEKVNRNRSTKNDFKHYSNLKNLLVFMEPVYKFNDEIIGEAEFRLQNPLLFKPVEDVIEDLDEGDRSILENQLVQDIQAKYGEDMLQSRASDDKPISGSERLSDRYCVIEKDLDYGVCITSHKSQGSNFETVFIDEADFDKLRSFWSFTLDCKVDSSKERNQLKYVSYTRPSKMAHVYYRQ